MDQYIGKLLDNRYEILELVGVGGMARVYKARCHRLNRLVALKILREDLSQDSELRRRFHDESQAVAMLSHPNIVAVYDVSRSSELEYIVMELIDGITLKQYMQKKGNKLNWREALHFITQITKALGHAHSRGIIHRDIKPHNVMVLRDGSVKVADFGIARVMSGGHSTLTQEALGSVHYISPEQARGSRIDARSDLYSAGVVLYEMITGCLPFEGDNPVSVAIQHINSIPLSPREIDPEIPEALEAITMKAMAPNPANRYASADEMLADLEEFRKNPSINFDYNINEFAVQEEPDLDRTQVHKVPPARPHPAEHSHSREESHNRYYDSDDYSDEPAAAGGFPWPVVTAVAVVLVFVCGVFYFLYRTVFSNFFGDPTPPVMVPNLIGAIYEQMMDEQEFSDRFEIVVGEEQYHDTAKPGTIIAQDPLPNTEASDGTTTITVTVSAGAEPIQMIDVENMEYREAFLALAQLGLKYDTEYANHDEVPKNHIISFTPFKDTPVTPGTEVHLIISLGPKIESVLVPNILELTREKAESDLKLKNLEVGDVEEVWSDTVPVGHVVEQYPVANTEVDEGTKVNFHVSKGPDPSTIVPEQVTKTIDIPLPTYQDDAVNLVVMVEGDIVLEADYDPTMDMSVPITVTGPAGSKVSVTYFYNGVLANSIPVEF